MAVDIFKTIDKIVKLTEPYKSLTDLNRRIFLLYTKINSIYFLLYPVIKVRWSLM
jgi:hypothetical protein